MNKSDMICEIESYLNHIWFAQDCFIAYKSLLDALHSHNKEVNCSPGFFTITLYCLSKTLCLELAKLYSGSGKEKTIQKLLNTVKANCNLFPNNFDSHLVWENSEKRWPDIEGRKTTIKEETNRIEMQLKEAAPIIQCLKGRRDKYLSHNDPEYFDGEINPSNDFPIQMNELQQLIDLAGCFCNDLLSYLDNRIIVYKSVNSNDLVNVLDRVKITE